MYTDTSGAYVCNPHNIPLLLLCQQNTSTTINAVSNSKPIDSTTIMVTLLVLDVDGDFSRSAVLLWATWVVIGCVQVVAVTVGWEVVVTATVVVAMERENKTLF